MMQPPPAAGPDGSGATKAKGSPCMAAQASTPNLRTLVHVPQPLPPWPAEQMATARVQGGRRESHECLRSPSIDRMAETFDHSHAHDRPHQQWRIWRLEQGAQPTAAVGGRRRAVQRRRELGLALGACARGWAGLGEVLAPRADAGGVDNASATEGDWERGGVMVGGGRGRVPINTGKQRARAVLPGLPSIGHPHASRQRMRWAAHQQPQSPEQSLADVAPLVGVVLPVAHGRQSGVAAVELPPGEKNPFRQALQVAPPVPGEQTETARQGSKGARLGEVLGYEAVGPGGDARSIV